MKSFFHFHISQIYHVCRPRFHVWYGVFSKAVYTRNWWEKFIFVATGKKRRRKKLSTHFQLDSLLVCVYVINNQETKMLLRMKLARDLRVIRRTFNLVVADINYSSFRHLLGECAGTVNFVQLRCTYMANKGCTPYLDVSSIIVPVYSHSHFCYVRTFLRAVAIGVP